MSMLSISCLSERQGQAMGQTNISPSVNPWSLVEPPKAQIQGRFGPSPSSHITAAKQASSLSLRNPLFSVTLLFAAAARCYFEVSAQVRAGAFIFKVWQDRAGRHEIWNFFRRKMSFYMGSPTFCKKIPACLSTLLPLTDGIFLHFLLSIMLFTILTGWLLFLPLIFVDVLGFAFVYFEDERDAEDAIRGLDNIPFGYDRRRLSVEWAKGERGRHRDGSRSTSQRPTKTLFVINFDPIRTRERDITKHFEPYGKVLNVRIRRNFAFVQFATQEDASKALEATQRSKLLDRVVSVEYALRDDDERDGKYDSPRRGGDGRHGDSPYRRSLSPAYRRRPSPDYGRARSPVYDRYNGPAYERQKSPEYGRYRSRSPARRSRT
ncbi:hypothetical protein V6N11_073244 [Hibiscus sabdariffa]|uniref:RRM domain-containing protein n=1 Tax=Hibiscus sabdariffa TaxID=183260 RepID=A0ABR2N673_9ROSI